MRNNEFVIIIDDNVSESFVINFFKNINFIKSIKQRKKQKSKKVMEVDEVSLISEKTLAEDWLSDENNRWDLIL